MLIGRFRIPSGTHSSSLLKSSWQIGQIFWWGSRLSTSTYGAVVRNLICLTVRRSSEIVVYDIGMTDWLPLCAVNGRWRWRTLWIGDRKSLQWSNLTLNVYASNCLSCKDKSAIMVYVKYSRLTTLKSRCSNIGYLGTQNNWRDSLIHVCQKVSYSCSHMPIPTSHGCNRINTANDNMMRLEIWQA